MKRKFSHLTREEAMRLLDGIVSNRQWWIFHRLTRTGEVSESGLFSADDLPHLLGALTVVCAACANNVP